MPNIDHLKTAFGFEDNGQLIYTSCDFTNPDSQTTNYLNAIAIGDNAGVIVHIRLGTNKITQSQSGFEQDIMIKAKKVWHSGIKQDIVTKAKKVWQ